jgi:bifunctional non-homologous end joining protein LigD
MDVVKHDVRISHPDKELFPGISKRDLADYHERVGRLLVRHARDRPVAMEVFPNGIEAQGIFIKNRPKHFPDWIPSVRVAKHGGSVDHVLIRETAALVYLVGQNVITPHVWTSRADDVEKPDRIVFDLDPSTQRFGEIRAAARATGELLRSVGLAPHAMTTGSRGIHVTVPIRRVPYDEAFAFAKVVADRLAAEHPRKLTTEFRKAKRGNRIFIDVLRNRYAQHAVPPYAVRPRPRAPVAAPLHWDELDDTKLRPDRWTIATMPKRVEADGDAWHGISGRARSVAAALRRL